MLAVVALVVIVGGKVGADPPFVRWYLVHQALNDQGNSLNLGDGSQDVSLNGGWSCSIGPPSKQMPAYEARKTACENGDKSFEFSVHCERQRPKDHTQIRFKDSEGRPVDFIEVGCERSE